MTPDGREFPATAITKYGAQMAVYSNMVCYRNAYNREHDDHVRCISIDTSAVRCRPAPVRCHHDISGYQDNENRRQPVSIILCCCCA